LELIILDRINNLTWHNASVTRLRREAQNGHKGVILWFTGLSGAGKSTLAHAVEELLHQQGCRTFVLDGDNVRHGLCSDLGFSPRDRSENIRRIGEMSKLFMEAGVIVMTAFISPFSADREQVRKMVANGNFFEIYCKSPIEVCEQRDVKGLYKKARAGIVKEFTGISSPYEAPVNPDLVINTGEDKLLDCAKNVIDLLINNKIIQCRELVYRDDQQPLELPPAQLLPARH
jgi:adenylylsulfate kinase